MPQAANRILIIAAKDEVFDALFRKMVVVADLVEGSKEEELYVKEVDALDKAIKKAGEHLRLDENESGFFVSDNWWPDHTRGVETTIDNFSQSLYDQLSDILVRKFEAWRIQVVVFGDPLDGKTMIGSVAISAKYILIDRALYGLLKWRGIDLRCEGEPEWRQSKAGDSD